METTKRARARGIAIALIALLGWVILNPAASHAAALNLSGFRLTSAVQFVDEDAGNAVITVERSDTRLAAQVRYITTGLTAQAPYDYTPEKSVLDFAAGQSTASFDVPIVNHGIDGLPMTLTVSLFGPSADGLGIPSSALLTILNNDPIGAVDIADPLGLPAAATSTDPLSGAEFYVDPDSEAATAARHYPAIKVIAEQPGAGRFGAFSYPNAKISVARYLSKAQVQEPGTIPQLTTYRLVDGQCAHGTGGDTAADVQSYENFINGFAQGVGSYRAVLFLEQDSLITAPCLSRAGLATRMSELNYAINVLKADCPHLIIYLDAGAADAAPATEMASLLRRAGVAKIQGFFLDATHFDWVSKEVRYGDEISRLTGDKHFVVNTGESGRGPLVPKDRAKNGNEVLCNPPGRGLGPKPTTDTGFNDVDAFVWIDNPGGSSGACVPGAPKGGVYWPAYALGLIKNANFNAK
jgi:endoglucanase